MADDEWTFVPPKKGSTSTCINNNKKHKRHLAKAKQLLNIIYSKGGDENRVDHDGNDERNLEMTIHLVEKCMRDLNNFNAPNSKFSMSSLVESIQEAANVKEKNSTTITAGGYEDSISERCVDEIVCYGIGTFYKPSDENMRSLKWYNPPLIQLACVLLLRRAFALRRDHCDKNDIASPHLQKLTYREQQEMVPMVYFEPKIQPLEQKVLDHFNVKVLGVNEQGKRRISTKQSYEYQQDGSSGANVYKVTPPLPLLKSSTLFYMPYCPMILYSNVLWANWKIKDKEDVLMDGRVVIMGNSFQEYNGTIHPEVMKDKTNAIFPLLPFTQERKVLTSKQGTGTKKKKAVSATWSSVANGELSLQEAELSFGGCAIMSFSKMDKSGELDLSFPKRPEEYFYNTDGVGAGLGLIF